MNPFSRATVWDLGQKRHDLLIIGGGATGAGIAREAALRGLSVALAERGDFASGTSSRSSRLIHGGLRYLEQRAWHRVRESLAERKILLRTAPHLVRPMEFLFPVFRGDRVSRLKLAAGMALYDLFALGGNVRAHRSLGKRALLDLEPLLRERGLTGGAMYWDAQCDDARLTLATARSAAVAGAALVNYMEVIELNVMAGRVAGAVVRDTLTGAGARIEARLVINATGPWCDRIRRLEDPNAPPVLRPTRGSHVMVPRAKVGHHHAITFLSPLDGRVMFVLPWGDRTYIGTTDTDTEESPEQVEPTEPDVQYLLRSLNALFPSAHLAPEDVTASWAGLRPLIAADPTLGASEVSREHRILRGSGGMLSVAGGKLTTYRRMAVEVVDEATAILSSTGAPRRPTRSRTATEPLPGGKDFPLVQALRLGAEFGLSEHTSEHLLRLYGSEMPDVARLITANRALAGPVHPGHPAIGAQVVHAVRREFARRLDDVMTRRIHLRYETNDQGREAADGVAGLMATELQWSESRRSEEVDRYLREIGGKAGEGAAEPARP
ncbi:MAG: glycerol-3-phosphate dehydrogenase/oxidase [Gemmatimonadota bacterium]